MHFHLQYISVAQLEFLQNSLLIIGDKKSKKIHKFNEDEILILLKNVIKHHRDIVK